MTGLRQVILFSLVGVFSISCSINIGRDTTSLAVPDGKVYTDNKRNLVIGRLGVLTCRFDKDPIAVVWLKGNVPKEAYHLVIWHEGTKSGPRYDDGTYDIDSNYSLIIKNVKDTDKGRYICRVSNQRGNVIYNHTDVTLFNHALETEAHINLEKGIAGVIPCKVNIRPKAVSWRKASANSSSVHLIGVGQYHNKSWGPGNEEGRFNISTDYSLHITNVDLEDRGEYFCVVFEAYTYASFQSATNISVFAQPLKPFPTIGGCSTTEDNCIFTIDSSKTITCEANGYYPDIGLYFKHGSDVVKTLQTQTWNNTDGTKNKSVSIVGHISKNLYTCVAFEIPGADGNSSTSVRLIRQNESPNQVTVIAPVVSLFLIAAGLLTLTILHKTGKFNFAAKLANEDLVSYAELWMLIEFVFEHEEFSELRDVIEALNHYDVGTILDEMTKEYYYRELCKWKWKCATNQKYTFYDKLYEKGLEKSLADLKEFRGAVSTKVNLFDFEHILREISDQENIIKFLESLHPTERKKEEKTLSPTFYQQALERLDKWTRLDRDINPVLILSSTLEKLNQKSANNFFLVPDAKKMKLEDKEIEQYNRKLSENYSKEVFRITPVDTLAVAKSVPEKNSYVLFNTEKMLRDWWNEQECSYYRRRCKLDIAVLLQTKILADTKPLSAQSCPANLQFKLTDRELQLIADSLNTNGKRQVCEHLGLSNISGSEDGEEFYDALCDWRESNKGELSTMYGEIISALKLQYAFANDQWPSDDELKLIADYIDEEYTTCVREHLELTNLSETSNSNDLFDALCAWRQSDKDDFPTTYRKLVYALKETNISGLLSPVRNDAIQKAEYVEIAFSLLMTDIFPVAKHLGIHETKLLSYRPSFNLSHLDKGTIGCVSTLITSLDKNKQREVLCRKLKEGGFPISIQLNIIAHQMPYGELSAIFSSPTTCKMNAGEKKEAPHQEPQEGDRLLAQEEIPAPDHADTATAPIKPKVTKAAESTKGFSRIKNLLPYISLHQYPDTTQERKTKEGDTFLGVSTAENSSDTIIPIEPVGVQAANASPDVKERATSSNETTFPIEPCDRKSEVSRHLSEIKKTLNLSVEDVSSSVDNPDEFTLFKMWKEKTRFSAVSERASVIKCLQDSGKRELARSVIEGKFVPEEISLSFVNHIVKKAKVNSQLKELAEALGMEKGFQKNQYSVDATSEIMWNRLLFTGKGSRNIPKYGSMSIKIWKEDCKSQMVQSQAHIVNQADKLVEYGFLDLAQELLTIYQQ